MTIKEKLSNYFTKQPKLWIAALGISALTIGFAGGMTVAGLSQNHSQLSQTTTQVTTENSQMD